MTIQYEKDFKKQLAKLPVKFQDKFFERLRLFVREPNSPQLRNHTLKGNLGGYWSINVTGDIRALYRRDGDHIIIFALIGSHSQLYGK
jgi:addiction module RelE/StbE family toxin